MNRPTSGNFTFSAKPVKTEHLSKPIKPRCSVYTGFTVLDLTKKTILANHKSFMPSMNILINEKYDDLSTLILDAKIPCKESIADSSTCSTKELSIAMTRTCLQSTSDYNRTFIHVVTSVKCGY